MGGTPTNPLFNIEAWIRRGARPSVLKLAFRRSGTALARRGRVRYHSSEPDIAYYFFWSDALELPTAPSNPAR